MKEVPICDGNETIYWRTRVRMMTVEIKLNTLILNIEEMWNTSDSICILKSTFFLVIICALFWLEPRVGGCLCIIYMY